MHISSEGELTEAVRALMGHRVESLIILISPMLENFGIRDPKDVNLHKLLRAVPHLIYNFLLMFTRSGLRTNIWKLEVI